MLPVRQGFRGKYRSKARMIFSETTCGPTLLSDKKHWPTLPCSSSACQRLVFSLSLSSFLSPCLNRPPAKEPSGKDSSNTPYSNISVYMVYVDDKTFSLSVDLEDQETEYGKENQCRHYDAGNLVYELEEARKAYDCYCSPYG